MSSQTEIHLFTSSNRQRSILMGEVREALVYGGHSTGQVCANSTDYLVMYYFDPNSPCNPVKEGYHFTIIMLPDGRRYPVFLHESIDIHTMPTKDKNIMGAHLTIFYETGRNTLRGTYE